jgi:hypothetical protein
MRLRELEVIEKIAAGNKLNVIVGEKGHRRAAAEPGVGVRRPGQRVGPGRQAR